MEIDTTLLTIISSLFVNLSAGWFGAAFIAPNFTSETGIRRIFILTSDVIVGIVCLVIANYIGHL